MAHDGKLLARARERLEQQRADNQAEHQRRLNQVYARVPEIQRIDAQLQGQMARLVRLTLTRKEDLGEQISKATGEVEEMSSYEEFFRAYKEQMEYNISLLVNADREKLDEKALLASYRHYLGEDAVIDVTYVDEIPVQASGKTMVCENKCPDYI